MAGKSTSVKGNIYKKVFYISLAVVVLLLTFHNPTQRTIANIFHQHLKNNGFGVHDVMLYGRVNADREKILAKTGIKYGQSIFSVDIRQIKENIESMGWIKSASVERSFPDRINIKIVERKPIAIWQYKKKLHLIDKDGIVITNKNIDKFSYLKSVVGENANKKAVEFLQLISSDKALSQIVVAGVYISNRRWNLIVFDKLTIKLPADNPNKAWAVLGRYAREKDLLARPISVIDMRVPKKIFIKLRKNKQNKT